jgi:hypothetical protein
MLFYLAETAMGDLATDIRDVPSPWRGHFMESPAAADPLHLLREVLLPVCHRADYSFWSVFAWVQIDLFLLSFFHFYVSACPWCRLAEARYLATVPFVDHSLPE